MPVTIQDVVNQLDREEPNYAQAARLGPDALPFVRQLIQGDNVALASKAAFLAGQISGEGSLQVLEIASRHPDPVVRVAAAASARNFTGLSSTLANTFLNDADPGVRKWGLRTLEIAQPHGIRPSVERIMNADPDPALREQARKVIDRLE
jgi:hypothetical protein